MSVQTVLLDFTIDPVRIGDEIASKDLLKFIKQGLQKYFENLKFVYDLKTGDGYLCCLLSDNKVFIQIRFYNHGIITINIEYFKGETENQIMSFDVSVAFFHPVFFSVSMKFYILHRKNLHVGYAINTV